MTGVLAYGSVAQAQDFELDPPIVYDTTFGVERYKEGDDSHAYVEMHTTFKNISENDFKFTWINITDTLALPKDWELTGVCDNILCRSERGEWFYGKPESTETVKAGTSFPMIVHIYAPSDGEDGTGIFKLQLKTLDQTDTAVYFLTKVKGTGVKAIAVSDKRVNLYPNPATTYMQVYVNKGLNAKQVNIVNIVGRQELSQEIAQGTEVTQVNTAALAPGMYMLNLTDAQGKMITSRKFVKQ